MLGQRSADTAAGFCEHLCAARFPGCMKLKRKIIVVVYHAIQDVDRNCGDRRSLQGQEF